MPRLCRSLAVTLAICVVSGSALPGQTPETRKLMREKLRYSQDLLEGLMTTNFPLITRSEESLAAIAKLPAWAILKTPEYERYTQAFLGSTQKLRDAAAARSTDEAFAAYTALTTSCYQCHKYIKGQRIARNQLP
jgi:cytochrome c556